MRTQNSIDRSLPMEVPIASIVVYFVLLQVSFALARMIHSALLSFSPFAEVPGTTEYVVEVGRNVALFAVVLPIFAIFLKRQSIPPRHIWISLRCNRCSLFLAIIAGTAVVSLSWFFALAVYPKMNPLFELPPPKNPINWRIALFVFLITTSLVSIIEEYLFRGLLYRSLRQRISAPYAGAVSALVYSGLHVLTISEPTAFAAIHALFYHFVFGVVAVYIFEIARSLNGPILMHITNNTLVAFIRYFLNVIPFEELGVELN